MFVRSARAIRSVRFNLTQSTAAKVLSGVSKVVDGTVYWGKVGAELAKEVYAKEGLAPPSTAEVQQVYQQLWKQAQELPAKRVEVYKYILDQGVELLAKKGAVYGVQLAGLFAVGEMIGRWNISGYGI